MKRTLALLLVAAAGCSHGGASRNANTGPDFVSEAKKPAVDKDLVASPGENRNEPLDVVAFAFDKTDLTPAITTQIDKAAAWLDAHPNRVIVLEGHTDLVGNANYNEDLSIRRIEAVRQRLIDSKIKADRIVTIPYGRKEAIHPAKRNDRPVVWVPCERAPKESVERRVEARKGIVARWTEDGQPKEVTASAQTATRAAK